MKKIFLIFSILQISIHFANAQWVLQFTSQDAAFNAIQFLNENTGYAVGQWVSPPINGYIYKTTNSGLNWNNLTLPDSMRGYLLTNLCFLDINTGFIIGETYHVFKTTNGGSNWTIYSAQGPATNQDYNGIKFFNEFTGYIGGRDGMIKKTTNSGINWITFDTANADINCMWFLDENTGFLGDAYGGLYKTYNGGINWNYQFLTDTTSNHYEYTFQQIKFVDYNTGYAVGDRVFPYAGAVFKTTNGGINWKSIFILLGNELYSIETTNNSIVYTCGLFQSTIFKSTNGGKDWVTQTTPTTYGPNFITFINSNIGFSCAGRQIMKTTNGGSVFINNISTEIPDGFKLYQNYPNPFNPSTNIKYQIRNKCSVTLKVFDLLGKEIATLINEKQAPGTYEVSFDGSTLPSGVYFYSLYSDGVKMDTKKLLLLK